ncbi:MAG: universal stress protein [Crocinitomicaceae bacterium]|nr:universal stress protein [Crocinitomicaceae bacterium]
MLKSPVYLVPFDFTPITENALRIGLDFAASNDGCVFLLHVVKTELERKKQSEVLDAFVKGLSHEDQKRIVPKLLVGDLYKEVAKAGDILGAPLSIMGTHGAKGLQKIFGSNAVKMISKSPTPFLVTVNEKPIAKIETIVMPFSFVKESLQVLDCVRFIAKEFNAMIHLVGYHDDKVWLKELSIENQQIARDVLAKSGIPCEIVNLPRKKSYEDELSDYLFSVRADLIATTYFKNGILPPPNTFVQVMLENDHEIPVLTVNADELNLSI